MDGGFCLRGLKDAIDIRMRLAVLEAIVEKGLFTHKPGVYGHGLTRKRTQFACVINRFQRKYHAQEHERAQNKSQSRICCFVFHNESGKFNESAGHVQCVFAAEKTDFA